MPKRREGPVKNAQTGYYGLRGSGRDDMSTDGLTFGRRRSFILGHLSAILGGPGLFLGLLPVDLLGELHGRENHVPCFSCDSQFPEVQADSVDVSQMVLTKDGIEFLSSEGSLPPDVRLDAERDLVQVHRLVYQDCLGCG